MFVAIIFDHGDDAVHSEGHVPSLPTAGNENLIAEQVIGQEFLESLGEFRFGEVAVDLNSVKPDYVDFRIVHSCG